MWILMNKKKKFEIETKHVQVDQCISNEWKKQNENEKSRSEWASG